MNTQACITKMSDSLERIKGFSPFRQGYVLGRLEEMVDEERKRQEAEEKERAS